MATQYIKYAKKCRKNFFSKIIGGGGHGPFWPGGGYAHDMTHRCKDKNTFCPLPRKLNHRILIFYGIIIRLPRANIKFYIHSRAITSTFFLLLTNKMFQLSSWLHKSSNQDLSNHAADLKLAADLISIRLLEKNFEKFYFTAMVSGLFHIHFLAPFFNNFICGS